MRSASVLVLALAMVPTATVRRSSYLPSLLSTKSWLLTQDHKRIAILYFIGVTFFFIVGGLLAFAVRLELPLQTTI